MREHTLSVASGSQTMTRSETRSHYTASDNSIFSCHSSMMPAITMQKLKPIGEPVYHWA